MVSEQCIVRILRCAFAFSNMYSHALATYQKALLVFWEKTSKTMAAVAESFKGYQYYEFTVIKDLAEPSRLLAEKNSKSLKEKEEVKPAAAAAVGNDPTEPEDVLIDISDDQLNDQLLELEKLTTIDRTATASANSKSDTLVDLSSANTEHDKLFSDLLSPISSGTADNTGFDAHWTAAFGKTPSDLLTDPTPANSSFLPSSLLSELLNKTAKPAPTNPKPKPKTTTDKSSWLNLFAELDPIQNPDAIGKSTVDEADRSC